MKSAFENQNQIRSTEGSEGQTRAAADNNVFGQLVFRPPTDDDLERVVEFMNLTWGSYVGFDEFNVEDMRHEWESPDFDPQKQVRLTIDPDGRILAYADTYLREPFTRTFGWIQVHPEWRDTEIVDRAYSWVESQARDVVPKAPEEARVSLVIFSSGRDTFTHRILEKRGYQMIRRFYKMMIEMNAPPHHPEPALGLDGETPLKIVPMQPGEERAVVKAIQDSFRDHWGFIERPFEAEMEIWEHRMTDPNFDPSLWFLAKDGERVAGISLCRPYVTGEEGTGWVSVLGVRRPWRRRGLATALLQHSFGEFYRRGKYRVGLNVDAQSLTGATRLYEKAGMHVDHEFHDYEIELRAGVELGTTEVEIQSDGD